MYRFTDPEDSNDLKDFNNLKIHCFKIDLKILKITKMYGFKDSKMLRFERFINTCFLQFFEILIIP